jgi:hypothetical protein
MQSLILLSARVRVIVLNHFIIGKLELNIIKYIQKCSLKSKERQRKILYPNQVEEATCDL